jgi:hypothetical protein
MDSQLFILWTNADELTFEKMVAMYAKNSLLKHWWDHVTLIVWGRTAKLTAESQTVQMIIKDLLATGVHVSACKACSDQLGVTDTLNEIGIETKYWGEPLTMILKENQKLLTI